MKKILLLTVFALLFTTFFPATQKTRAAEIGYARVLNQVTYLYNSADTSSPCFLIPETYYVKLIRDDGDFYFVEYLADLAPYYKSIAGYCRKTDLYVCDYVPGSPYLYYNIEVYDGAKGYKNSTLSKADYLFNSGNPVIYYGKMKINNVLFYYALAHGEFRCYNTQLINNSLNSSISFRINVT